jgi:DNA repair exonuclease SbcCD ATPase subunit
MKLNDLLRLNLQYFAEGDNATPSEATINTEQNGVENTQNSAGEAPKQPTDKFIPKSRFDEVNQKFKDVQSQLDALLAEKKETERRAQEEQGKYQELYENTTKEFSQVKTQYESVETRAKELEGVINTLIETKLSTIPEDFHDLIPGNLTPEQKLDWINKAETKGLFGKREQKPIGESSNPSHAQSFDLNTLSPVQLLKAGYGSK